MEKMENEAKKQLWELFKAFNEEKIEELVNNLTIFTIADLRTNHFEKLKSEKNINDKGVYFILNLHENEKVLEFEDTQIFNKIYGKCKNSDEYKVKNLEDSYNNIKFKRIIYIGKADGEKGLFQRLKPYLAPWKSHSGGRAIWKIKDAEQLGVTWITLNEFNKYLNNEKIEEAKILERKLLKKYVEYNGNLPIANQI